MQVNAKLGNSTTAIPETAEPMVAGNYVWNPMQNAITIQLLLFAQICENAHQVTRIDFWVLPSPYSQDPCTNFTINRQMTTFRARLCLLEVH